MVVLNTDCESIKEADASLRGSQGSIQVELSILRMAMSLAFRMMDGSKVTMSMCEHNPKTSEGFLPVCLGIHDSYLSLWTGGGLAFSSRRAFCPWCTHPPAWRICPVLLTGCCSCVHTHSSSSLFTGMGWV